MKIKGNIIYLMNTYCLLRLSSSDQVNLSCLHAWWYTWPHNKKTLPMGWEGVSGSESVTRGVAPAWVSFFKWIEGKAWQTWGPMPWQLLQAPRGNNPSGLPRIVHASVIHSFSQSTIPPGFTGNISQLGIMESDNREGDHPCLCSQRRFIV